jgi:hypothetical protein
MRHVRSNMIWAPRLAGLPANIVYAAKIEGVGLVDLTYGFDLGTFVQDDRSRQMRSCPTVGNGVRLKKLKSFDEFQEAISGVQAKGLLPHVNL